MILQLNPCIPVSTEKGDGRALFLLDYGPEDHVLWGVVINSTNEVWWVPNNKIRLKDNWSMGR